MQLFLTFIFVAKLVVGWPTEGSCRSGPTGQVQQYASGYWQDVSVGSYVCVEGGLELATGSASRPTCTTCASSLAPTQALEDAYTDTRTGYSECDNVSVPFKSNAHGVASYKPGGRMASVYYPEGYVFRCNMVAEPDVSEYYAAVWTRYDPALTAQPMPQNCNQTIKLRNNYNGRAATAIIKDRCASCVGVNHQTSDPTTLDRYVNGATIDLSPRLWEYLFDGSPDDVFDIDYDGPVYSGSPDQEPDLLTQPNCENEKAIASGAK